MEYNTKNPADQEDKDKTVAKESVNALHYSKPSEDISILSKNNSSEEVLEKIHETILSHHKPGTLFESNSDDDTHLEKEKKRSEEIVQGSKSSMHTQKEQSQDRKPEKTKERPMPTVLDKKPRVSSAASVLNYGDRIIRNQSDIFSLKEQTSIGCSIFSVNGSPSRKVFRKKEAIPSNVFPFGQLDTEPPSDKLPLPQLPLPCKDRLREIKDTYSDMKRPSSSTRNPLTGTGLHSNDEYRFKASKRKDGNPVLGLGYSPEITSSSRRIPPGGYSHQLW